MNTTKNQNYIYDVCIVGAGPAGCTAAIYASRAELNTIVFEGAYSKEITPGGYATSCKFFYIS